MAGRSALILDVDTGIDDTGRPPNVDVATDGKVGAFMERLDDRVAGLAAGLRQA